MRKAINLLLSFFLFSISSGQKQQTVNKLSVELNENIATYSIVERLLADKQGQLFYIDGKADDQYLPMVHLAFTEMKHFSNEKIVEQFISYLKITGNQQDLTYQALLRANSFPQRGYKYTFEGVNSDSVKLNAVKVFVENLRQFYMERKLADFFKRNAYFIQGAIKEVKKNLPQDYVNKMEAYYGENISAFKFYINPFDDVPYDTDFWHGNGPKIKTKTGWVANMISSAYLPLEKQETIKSYKKFGFDHPKNINIIVTHEFGHSFVNPTLDPYEAQINKSDSLMSFAFKEKMEPQGYGYWPVCIIEHMVRLGEIRIAQINGDEKKANELRDRYISEFHFVLIPDFEKVITEYENNRQKYKAFKNFVPRLLSVLDTITVVETRKKLELPIQKYMVTINITVPDSNNIVYITGNQPALGNWNPQKVVMKKPSAYKRTITFESYPNIELKFTNGTWETQARVAGKEKGKNIQLDPEKETVFNFEIESWE